MAHLQVPRQDATSINLPAKPKVMISRPKHRGEFEVAVICALKVEFDAVEALFDEYYEDDEDVYGKARGDTNAYTTGRIGKYHVVLAFMPGMGSTTSAAVAWSFRTSFIGIKLGLVVGVCGGVPRSEDDGKEIMLGDVIVSTGIVQTDFGRQYFERSVRKDTLQDSLGRPNAEIRATLAKMSGFRGTKRLRDLTAFHLSDMCQKEGFEALQYPGSDKDVLFEPTYRHRHRFKLNCSICQQCSETKGDVCEVAVHSTCVQLECASDRHVPRSRVQKLIRDSSSSVTLEHKPEIHFGLIASANQVMKSAYHRDQIAKRENVIAFEMEGAGVWDAFPTIVVKGVCDYADSHKNKAWQFYAAAVAAACMKAILYSLRKSDEVDNSQRDLLSGFSNLTVAREHSPDPSFLKLDFLEKISNGDAAAVQKLFHDGQEINFQSKDGRTPLGVAVTAGHVLLATYLLEQGAQVDMVHQGSSPLCWVSEQGRLEIVRILLEYGADVNFTGDRGVTPLLSAAEKGHFEILQTLLNRGADVSARTETSANAFVVASTNGHVRCARLLMQYPASLQDSDKDGSTALLAAIANGDEDLAEAIILEHEQAIYILNEREETPLTRAIHYDRSKIFHLLLQKGAHRLIETDYTPLQHCVAAGKTQYAAALLELGVAVDERTQQTPETPLELALTQQHEEIVKLLVLHGASIEIEAMAKYMMYAAACGHLSLVTYLLDIKPDLAMERAEFGGSGLHSAAYYGHNDVVQMFLDRGVPIDFRNTEGRTALQTATLGPCLTTVRLLLRRGADIDARDEDSGMTALDYAASWGALEVVECLISKGAVVDSFDNLGNTSIHHSVKKSASQSRLKIVQLLHEKGASLVTKNVKLHTACHFAADASDPECLTWLLSVTDFLESRDKEGKTPLHWAAGSDYPRAAKTIQVCLNKGANLEAATEIGETPLHLAVRTGLAESVALLLRHGANCEASGSSGFKPIHFICDGQEPLKKLDLLVAQGCNIDALTAHPTMKVTPLLLACGSSKGEEVAKSLISRGAALDVPSNIGTTALFHAADEGRADLTLCLLDAGASVNIQDKYGKTALHFAVEKKNLDVISVLLKHGADTSLKDMLGKSAIESASETVAKHIRTFS